MSSSTQSGARSGAQDQMSPSDITALEKAFQDMLSSTQVKTVSEGSTTTREPAHEDSEEFDFEDEYSWLDRMTPSESAAFERAALETLFTAEGLPVPAEFRYLLTSESDIAFPSGNDVYDHSLTARFSLDETELKNPAAPKDFFDIQNLNRAISPADAERSDVQKRFRNPSDAPDPNAACIMGFGADNGAHVGVVCDPRTRQFLRAHPLFRKPLCIEPHYSAIPVYIAPSGVHADAGQGLFAACRITVKERLFREPPLLISPARISGHIALQFDTFVVDRVVPPRVRAAYDALHNCWPASNNAEHRFGIVRTNSIALNFPTRTREDPLTGCFQLLSRANHSCMPNVVFEWDYKTFQGSLIAVRPIEAGEEIFLSYTDISARKAVRRETLQRMYRFKCTCLKCGPN
ncbi:SET domain-containing protein [Exidia glandulosa HHB12029]|uniref:SET domain-containing protein n=1 Tax=Exidia glandulosa HHB12029 TaxID=1314781 RepID=A0A165J1U5_EXIGL|nr:SET domain-containing protein [Exidia glandulosa HHB12029]